MSRQTKIINMSLPFDIYSQVEEFAKEKGISKSQFLKDSLKQYLAAETRWRQIRKWGAESARSQGVKDEADVEKIIHEYRKERSRS